MGTSPSDTPLPHSHTIIRPRSLYFRMHYHVCIYDLETSKVCILLSSVTVFVQISSTILVQISIWTNLLISFTLVLLVIQIYVNATNNFEFVLAKTQEECKQIGLESKQLITSLHKSLHNKIACKEQKNRKELQLCRKNEEKAIKDLQNLKRNFREVSDKLLCIICQENDRGVIILPCKHLCLCQICADKIKIKKKTCPVCQQPISDYLKFYL